jgi:hypothetical protein
VSPERLFGGDAHDHDWSTPMNAPNEPAAAAVAGRKWLGRQRPCPVDLFDAWVFAENDVEVALASWWAASPELKADAYAAYVAALDREACAADVLRLAVS